MNNVGLTHLLTLERTGEKFWGQVGRVQTKQQVSFTAPTKRESFCTVEINAPLELGDVLLFGKRRLEVVGLEPVTCKEIHG